MRSFEESTSIKGDYLRIDLIRSNYLTPFFQHFRFTKPSVHCISELFFPEIDYGNKRGLPIPEQKVCAALCLVGGNFFMCVQGLCGGASKSTIYKMLYDVAHKSKRVKL